MKAKNANAFFWPYDSVDEIFRERFQPEFGLVPSVWRMSLEEWQFYYAEHRDFVPPDFATVNCSDKGWHQMILPAVWQQQGYGFTTRLLYDDFQEDQSESINKRVRSKLSALGGNEEKDEVGVYRTWVQFSSAYLDRAVYFQFSGIRGRFSFYVNGNLILDSQAVYATKKILLSPYLVEGNNLIAIMVYRLDENIKGRQYRESGTFGFSGIFRIPEIVAESLVEISSLDILATVDEKYTGPFLEDAINVSAETAEIDDEPLDLEEEIRKLSQGEVTDKKSKSKSKKKEDKSENVKTLAQNAESSSKKIDLSVVENENFPDVKRIPARDYTNLPAIKGGELSEQYTEEPTQYVGRLRFSAVMKNHLQYPITIKLIPQLAEVLDEYDLYHWPIRTVTNNPITMMLAPDEEKELTGDYHLKDISPWTEETPYLYDLLITVTDSEDQIICVKKMRFGFRTAKAENGALMINGKNLFIRGIKYFNFDPVEGLAVPLERFRQDVLLMKRAGLNAMLMTYYPADPFLYMLCDQYGLYVLSQSRVSQFYDMRKACSYHPCVVVWSFSRLRYDETRATEQKQQTLLFNDSRPFYLEKDKAMRISDILSLPGEAGAIYGSWCDAAIDLKTMKKNGIKWILPERGHQTKLLKAVVSSPYKWIHQADLEEISDKQKANVAQGLVNPDRELYPIYFDVKKQTEPIRVLTSEQEPAQIVIENTRQFGELPDISIEWGLLLDGRPLITGEESLPAMRPLEKRLLRLPFSRDRFLTPGWMEEKPIWDLIYRHAVKKELILDLHFYIQDEDYIYPEHFEIAFFQQIIIDRTAGRRVGGELAVQQHSALSLILAKSEKKLQVSTEPKILQIKKGPLSLGFSRKSGGLSNLNILQNNFFAGSMQPSFFRAATNADRSDSSFTMASTVFSREVDWRTMQQQIHYKKFHYEMVEGDFSMIVHYTSPAFKGDLILQYIVRSNKEQDAVEGQLRPDIPPRVELTLRCSPKGALPRMGLRVRVKKEVNRFLWYGRGPSESYSDRRDAMSFGFFEGKPEDMYQEYVRPQENGAHVDTQYLILSDHSDLGLRIRSANPDGFSFSAMSYPPEAIDDSTHQENLEESEYYELFLDFFQSGVERTGREAEEFDKNKVFKETFILEPCDVERSDHKKAENETITK